MSLKKLERLSSFFLDNHREIYDPPKGVELTSKCPECKEVMNFLDGEDMTLWLGSNGNWYTSYETTAPYGDLMVEIDVYGMFVDPLAAKRWFDFGDAGVQQ